MMKRFLCILCLLAGTGCLYGQGWTYNEGVLNVTSQIWVQSYEFGNTHPSTYNRTPYSDYYSQIKTIILSDNITYVGQGAFTGCTAAERLVVGKGVKTYAYNAFYFPKSTLKTIEWNAANAGLVDQYNGYVSKSNQGPFGVTESWMEIENRNYAANAETIIFGPDVVTIPNYFAYFMTKLKKVEFGEKVTSIGMYAFVGITPNTVLTAYMPNPASVTLGNTSYNPFPSSASDRKKITLRVPAAYVSKYKAANIWKDFNIVAINNATVTFVDADGNTIGTPQVVEYGQSATPPTPPTREGYTFVGWIGSYQNVTADATIYASYEYANQVLNGVFSVSETEAVQFSPGNLQYHATAGSHQCADGSTQLGVWRFAEHQWDYVGDANANISSTYNGWIDLFCWGTSGWNSGANAYQPYSTSEVNSDYYPGGSAENSLIGAYRFADWGVYNAILNGGNQPDQWRTLTSVEWGYLFHDRPNAEKLFGLGTVNGVQGTIILPDGWHAPAGVTFVASAENGLAWNGGYYLEDGINHYLDNVFVSEPSGTWDAMAASGAVFLPASGYRGGTSVYGPGVDGRYWSSTANGSLAYNLGFRSGGLGPRDCYDRLQGRSVRLVREITIYTISTAATNGSVTGGGLYSENANAILTATPDECYEFVQWSDGNTDNPRTVTVTGDATYTAEFEKITYTVKGEDSTGGKVKVEK